MSQQLDLMDLAEGALPRPTRKSPNGFNALMRCWHVVYTGRTGTPYSFTARERGNLKRLLRTFGEETAKKIILYYLENRDRYWQGSAMTPFGVCFFHRQRIAEQVTPPPIDEEAARYLSEWECEIAQAHA